MTEPDRIYQERDAKGNPVLVEIYVGKERVPEHEIETLARCLLLHIRDFFGT